MNFKGHSILFEVNQRLQYFNGRLKHSQISCTQVFNTFVFMVVTLGSYQPYYFSHSNVFLQTQKYIKNIHEDDKI